MITNETRDDIARLAIEPIRSKLSAMAKEEVVEEFCKPNCGHEPEAGFCPGAESIYKAVLSILLRAYRDFN